MQQNDKENDPERRQSLKADELKLVVLINKRYVNPTRKNLGTKVDLIDDETRKVIEKKISSAKSSANAALLNSDNFDTNIFDGAQQTVLEHLAHKCYPNFLKSEVYIDHVQSAQNAESDASRGGGAMSSASSVSVRLSKADDSGISGITAASAPDPNDQTKSLPNLDACSVINPPSSLPTVDEDKELKILSDSNSSNRSKLPEMSFIKPRLLEHPSSTQTPPPITSASYAYHANSSNWNPVSRQDSEIQSQSSGAVGGGGGGGDTTDDNYSSFTDGPSSTGVPVAPVTTHRSRHHHSKWESRRQQKLEKKKLEESAQRNKDISSQIIPR